MSFVHEHGIVSREDFIKQQGLPKITYFSLNDQQDFINNLPLVRGSTINSLAQIQQSLESSNVPLIIPYTSSYNKKWSYQQLEAFAKQGIQVYQNKEDGVPQFPYIYNLVGSGKAPGYVSYYERFLTTEQPDTRIYSGGPVSQGFVGLRGGTIKYDPSTESGLNVAPTEITPSSTQKKPESVFVKEPEPQVTTDHIEPPVEAEPEKLYEVYGQTLPLSESAVDYYESLGVSVTTSQVDPPIAEPEPQVTTDHIEPPGVEEPAVTTSQVEPPGQEVTAEISWFGDTWFPYHFNFDKRRR